MGQENNGANGDNKGDNDKQPTPENVTMFQGFEWNVRTSISFARYNAHIFRFLQMALTGSDSSRLPGLKEIGIDNVWIPPACKASSNQGNGYDIYDLWDLGEFDQKDGKRTKWGTKEELLELSKKAKELGVGLYLDAVLNHKAGADDKETFEVIDVDENGMIVEN